MAQLTLGGNQLQQLLSAFPDAQITGYTGNYNYDPVMMDYLRQQQTLYDQQQQDLLAQQGPGGILGFAQNVVEGIADPFVRLGKAGHVAASRLGGGAEDLAAADELARKYFGENANLGQEFLKGAIGVGSWFVPGLGPAGTLGNVLSRGALAGGLGALSRQNFLTEGVDIGQIGTGALLGAGTSGAMYGAGKLLGKVFKGTEGINVKEPTATTPIQKVDRFIAEQGDELAKAGADTTAIAGKLGTGSGMGNARLNAIQNMYNQRMITGNEAAEAVKAMLKEAADDPLAANLAKQGGDFISSLPDKGLKMTTTVPPQNQFDVMNMRNQLGTLKTQYDSTLAQLQDVGGKIDAAQMGIDPRIAELVKKSDSFDDFVSKVYSKDPIASYDKLLGKGPGNYDLRIGRAMEGFQSLDDILKAPEGQSMLKGLYNDVKLTPGKDVTVYRAVGSQYGDKLNIGDYVSPSQQYAKDHLAMALGDKGKLITQKVPATDIIWDQASDGFIYSPQNLRSTYGNLEGLYKSVQTGQLPKQALGTTDAGKLIEQTRGLEAQVDKIMSKPKSQITAGDLTKVENLRTKIGALNEQRLAGLGQSPANAFDVPEDLFAQDQAIRQQLGGIGDQMEALRTQIGEKSNVRLPENLRSLSDDPYDIFIKKGVQKIDIDKLNPIERKGLLESYKDLGFTPAKGHLDITGDFRKSVETIETLLRQEGLPRNIEGISQLADRLGQSRDELVRVAQGRVVVDTKQFSDVAARKLQSLAGGYQDDAALQLNSTLYDYFPEKAIAPDPTTGGYSFKTLDKWSAADLYDITQNKSIKDTAFKVLYGKSQAAVRPDAAAKAALYDTANQILKREIPGYDKINNAYRVLFEQNENLRREVATGTMRDLIRQSNRFSILGTNVPIGMMEQPFWKGVEKTGNLFGRIGNAAEGLGARIDAAGLRPAADFAGARLQNMIPSMVGQQAGIPQEPFGSVLGTSTVDPTTGQPTQGTLAGDMQMGGAAPTGMTGMGGGGMGGGGFSGGGAGMGFGGQPQQAIGSLELLQAVNDALGGTVDTLPLAMQVAKFVAPQFGVDIAGAGGISEGMRRDITSLQLADSALNEFEGYLSNLGLYDSGILAKTLGRGREFASGIGLDENLSYYNDMRNAMSSRLARALGETGVLNNYDIQRALDAIPTITDSRESAARKMQFIRGMLQEAQQLTYSLGGQSQGLGAMDTDLSSLLSQAY